MEVITKGGIFMLRLKTELEILEEKGTITKGTFAIISEKSEKLAAINAEFQFSVEGFGTPNWRFALEKKGRVFLNYPEEASAKGNINIVIASLFMMTFCRSRGAPVPQPLGGSLSGKFITPAISSSQAEELCQVLS